MVIIEHARLLLDRHGMFIPEEHNCSKIITHILDVSKLEYELTNDNNESSKQDREFWAKRFSDALGKPVDSNHMSKLVFGLDPEYLVDVAVNAALKDPDIKAYIKSL